MISVTAAFDLILETVSRLDSERIPLEMAVGRVLSQPIGADVDSPPHRKSLMDGYAVNSADINAGLREFEVIETIPAGHWPQCSLKTGQAARIMTGAPVPDGADAVVMIELTQSSDNNQLQSPRVTIQVDSLTAGKHVAQQADNFCCGQTIFQKGHRIRAIDIGLLAEVGAAEVDVYLRPTMAVLATGNELVECNQIPQRAQIRNSNAPMLQAMGLNRGLPVTRLPIAGDNEAGLHRQIEIGLQHDLLLITGGVSAGLLDLVPSILQQIGVHQVFHKVDIKPGKPIWFGYFDRLDSAMGRSYVFGLPGNPVSSLIGFELFVSTAIELLEGRQIEGAANPLPESQIGRLAVDHQTRGGRPTFWPAKPCHAMNLTDKANPQTEVQTMPAYRWFEPLNWKGSSDLLTLGQSEGLIYFPADKDNHNQGDLVTYYPIKK